MSVFIPPKLKYFILDKINSNTYKIVIIHNKNWVKSIILKSLTKKPYSILTSLETPKTLNNVKLINFFSNWYTLSNKKIKFSGKGYKIIKRGANLNLSLNTSHPQ